MNTEPPPVRFSTTIELHLIVDEKSIRLSHTGPDFVIAREPVQLPGGPATVVISVDGQIREWKVLIDPMPESSDWIRTRAA